MSKTKVLLVDDHPLLCQGIHELLNRQPDFEVVGEARDGEEAVRLTNRFLPDVVVMDVYMPKLNGLDATKQIKRDHPEIAVLVLTVHDDEEYITGLLDAGAAGYLLKSAYGEELLQAIRALRTGAVVLHRTIAEKLLKRAVRHLSESVWREPTEVLTARESDVLRLAVEGMSNCDIAFDLGISLRTVKGHLVNIYAKMGVNSRTKALLYALRHGFVSLEDTRQGG